MKLLLGACAFGALFVSGYGSAAVLLGESVSVEYRMPDINTQYPQTEYTPQVFVVGGGVESVVTIEGVTDFNIDFDDTSLQIFFDTSLPNPNLQGTSFNGLVFTSTAFNQISGVTIDGLTNLAGFDASRVFLVGDELRLDFNGLTYNTDTELGLNFTSSAAAIPEPASWGMLVLGCAFVGGAMRRSKRQQRVSTSFA